MRTLQIAVLLISLGLLGCKSASPYLDKTELTITIQKARSIAVNESTNLDDESRKIILEQDPKWGYYKLAGDYAQYFFIWPISSNRTLEVSGQGNIKELEGHKVMIHPARTTQ